MRLRKSIRLYLFIITSAIAMLACQFSFSTANIGEVYTSPSSSGTEATDTYLPLENFYVSVEIKNAPESTEIEVVWYALDVGPEAANGKISSEKLTTASMVQVFELEPDPAWRVGKYRAEIYLNGEQEERVEFEVVPAQMDIFG